MSQRPSFPASYSGFLVLLLVAICTGTAFGQSRAQPAAKGGEQNTARYLDRIKDDPLLLRAFLKKMPKGADLHSHLSGAVYAESFLRWGAEAGLCLDPVTLAQGMCETGDSLRVADAYKDPVLFRRIIDAWSMRNWRYSGLNGHDQFFDSFGKFGGSGTGRIGDMLAEVASRAARQEIIYMEQMLTPDGGAVSRLGRSIQWRNDYRAMRDTLLARGLRDSIRIGMRTLDTAEIRMRTLLGCGSAPNEGCGMTIRYLYQVGRGGPDPAVFAQILAGFEMAEMDRRVLGFNLVQPEDYFIPMERFSAQMEMIDALRPLYRAAHISLHAGELAFGMVPPDSLCCHIRRSVEKGHAERIGHGVAVMYEDNPMDLLKLMASRRVMVEVCLTSNDVILGVTGKHHPYAHYVANGVPVALATDDEGVSRGDLTNEFVRAVMEQGAGYLDLKRMARNSLEYSFVSGASIWRERGSFARVPACPGAPGGSTSGDCQRYLDASQKARLQWKLEEELAKFEAQGWGGK